MALCPTCHSEIGTGSIIPSEQISGIEGIDSDGNPIPFWSDDPMLTAQILSGDPFFGLTKCKKKHIQEIQDLRRQQEIDAGLSASEQTDFSDIDSDNHASRRHIIELRESTEKILSVLGLGIEDYFKLDSAGNEQAQNPKLVTRYGASDPQIEWIDVNRGEEYITKDGSLKSTFDIPGQTSVNSPTLPGITKLKAIHIEDLRHPISVGLPALMVARFDSNNKLFKAQMLGAKFKEIEEC